MCETMLYNLKLQKNIKKESFNRFLYKKENDSSYEYNSGENLVDTTGYIPLAELLSRCGLKGIQEPDWSGVEQGVDFKTDKFSDKFEAQNEINNIISAAIKKQQKGKKDSSLETITTIDKPVDNLPNDSLSAEDSTEK